MNRAENRAEQYRALAEDVCNRASREPNPIVKADPIQDMLERARN
jgi:hypothetical protein